jgi:cephalosporin hydroxylase
LLEIGIYQGGSIRTWHEYFPSATIAGVDIVEPPPGLRELAPRVKTFQADQSDPQQLRAIAETFKASGGIDIVIDDGSHLCSHQITSYKALYPYLNPGGIYFVEDVTTSYRENPYEGGLGRPDTCIRFAQDLVPFIPMSMGCVPARHPWEADLDFIHFSGYGGLIAIGKLSAARKAKILG